ncbi:MAG: TonB family protein [Gemmatimonadaceae bacterium]
MAAAALFPVLLRAQAPQQDSASESGTLRSGAITGTVRDSAGLPVSAAQVSVAGLIVRASTGNDGVYKIAGVPLGARTIRVRRIGFRPDSVRVDVTPGGEATGDVTLGVIAQQMAPVVVQAGRRRYTGRMASFFERRDQGMGTFFTAEEIDRRNPSITTDLFRQVPGVRIERAGAENVVFFRGQRCVPLVWIDGTPATAGYLNPDYFAPNTLGGIEIYPGVATVPSELMWMRGKGACGVIALWTRLDDPPGKSPTRKVSAQELANLVASLRLYTAEQVDEPARADSSEPVTPFYPDSLERSGRSGRVLAEFVVDTTGRAEMDTFGVVLSTDRLFTDAVRRAVRAARFIPARLDGKAVRQLMQIPFTFVSPSSSTNNPAP